MKTVQLLAAGAAVGLMLGAAQAALAAPQHDQDPHAAHGAGAGAPMPAKVENFRLADQDGKQHELYRHKDAKAVVLVTQGVGCPISRNINATVTELQKAYAGKGVDFFLLNPNLHDTREAVLQEAKEFGFTMPVLLDAKQQVGEQLGVTRTATVYVIDPRSWTIVYRGPPDDRVTYGVQRAAATEPWAKEAIDVLVTGQGRVSQRDRPAEGCLINFEGREARTAAAH